MEKAVKSICPKCGAELPYKAVTPKEAQKKPHKSGVGAYCGQCGNKLISE